MAAPLERLVEDHLRAWSALAAAAADVAGLPARTARRLVLGEDAAPAVEPLAEALARVAELEAQVARLRQAYAALEREAAGRAERSLDDQKLALWRALEPLMTQLPLVRHAVAAGRPVEARDMLDLLGPLDEALAQLGITAIGEIGLEVPFDPGCHQATAGAPPATGTPVVVKAPGFRLDDRILRRARVVPR